MPAQSDRHAGAGDGAPRLAYIRAMLGELRTMAEAERCDMLAYLIEMAALEADHLVRGPDGRRRAR